MTRTPDHQEIKEAIRAKALALGFESVGFASAETDPNDQKALETFTKAGFHGDMAWMARGDKRRGDPKALMPGAKTIIVLGMNYGPGTDPTTIFEHPERGAISVYAQGRDYHDTVKKRLKQLGRWMVEAYATDIKVFVDTAPVMEKPLAQRGGIGWQGKHTNLVSRTTGNWMFLGAIFTTLELEPDAPEVDHCGSCRKCLDICPTEAFVAPYKMDARRCISYLTIEHKGPIDLALRPGLGNHIYGCDDCQLVCPWNKYAQSTVEPDYLPREGLDAPQLIDLFNWTEQEFLSRLEGSPIRRIGYECWLRNIAVALGNAKTSAPVVNALQQKVEHQSALVREHVTWALDQHQLS